MTEATKIGDLLPDAIKPKSETNAIALIQQEKLNRTAHSEEIAKVFSTLNTPQKYEVVKNQIKGIDKTLDTVKMPGRILAKDEPEVLYIMIEQLFQFAGIDNAHAASGVLDILIESYWWMALQDFALFFRNIKSGHYGEIYGKMNGMWITGKMKNFQQSVQYNLAMDKEAEHFARKQQDGCRGLDAYYDDIKPEIIE